jgi:protein tyrosine/serine phosphatase
MRYGLRIFNPLFLIVILVMYLSLGCAYLGYIRDPFKDIPNFHQVDKVLYRGGQPNENGLIELKKIGIKTIVCLRDENKDEVKAEIELASKLGVEFVSIPLSVYRMPTDEQVLRFLDIVTDESKQPVFIHCYSGRDRTGAMVAMYRVVVQGWTIKQAYKEAKNLGLWPYHGEGQLHKFIHQLKDKKIYFQKVGRKAP